MASEDNQDFVSANNRLKSFLKGDANENEDVVSGVSPIADLFPNCTVMFAGEWVEYTN